MKEVEYPGYHESVMWNPWNKVVQDHRDGTIHHDLTNTERERLGLPVPWTSEMGAVECRERPVYRERPDGATPSEIVEALRRIGGEQAGLLRTDSGELWHPIDVLLTAADEIEFLRAIADMNNREVFCYTASVHHRSISDGGI